MINKLVEKFCNNLEKFVSDLEDAFPEESDIGLLLTGIQWLNITDKKRLIDDFGKFVFPYKEYIYKSDIDFFLNFSYDDIIKDTEGDEKEGIMKVTHFKKLFNTGEITKESTNNIFAHLKLLCVLYEKSMELSLST